MVFTNFLLLLPPVKDAVQQPYINSNTMKTTNIFTFILLLVIPFSLQAQTPVTLGDYVFTASTDDISNYTDGSFNMLNYGEGFEPWENIGAFGFLFPLVQENILNSGNEFTWYYI